MKHQYKYLSILLAAGLLSACSSEEPQGNQLPTSQYPLKVTATVGAPQSRSIGKDSWAGDGSETFGVRIGENGRVAKYVITDAVGKAEADPGSNTLYWDNRDKSTVSAWLPYDAQTNVDISDQSAGFAAFDYLTATADGQSYLAPVSLQFKHKMAKVRCVLKPGKGIAEADLNAAAVKFAGYTSATFTEGSLSGSAYGWITPASDYEALLVPQNMAGKDFITIKMGGKEYVYTPADDNAGTLKEGFLHQYSITVNADGIEVSSATGGEWTDGGSEDVGSTEIYTSSELKLGDFYYSDGTTSDGGLRKLHADGFIEWTETRPNPESGKTVIGIVIYAGQHPNDKSDYTQSGIGEKNCHGYAVALQDATSEHCMWGKEDVLGCGPTDENGNKLDNYNNPDSDWNGYKWTQIIVTAAGGKDNLNATEQAGYPATWYAVVDYPQKVAAPTGSSGWFLPSIGQLQKICQINSSLFGSVSGAESLSEWYYLSSSESSVYPQAVSVVYAPSVSIITGGKYYQSFYVRPVLAF